MGNPAHLAVSICIATFLTGCGGSSSPVAPASSYATAVRGEHVGSRMLANLNRQDLLYVATGDNVYILTLRGEVVGSLGVSSYALCADQKGKVFVTQTALGEVYEYKHGSLIPVQTLADGDQPLGCAVDPQTGNLAVTNEASGAGEVAIYPKGLAPATWYHDGALSQYGLCGYDDSGNLFVTGVGSANILAELPKGSTSFKNFSLEPKIDPFDSVQWDGRNLTLSNPSTQQIVRLKIGNVVTVVGATRIREWKGAHSGGWPYVQTWLQPSRFYGQLNTGGDVGYWMYPRGGKPADAIGPVGSGSAHIYGVAVSVSSK